MKHYAKHLLVLLTLFSSRASTVKAVGLGGSIQPVGGYTVDPTSTDVSPYSTQLENIISNSISFMTILAGLYFLIYFIIGAMQWTMSGGDSNKLEAAKQKLTNAAIGLIIVIASYSVIYIAGKVLGLDILNLANLINTGFTF